MDFIKSIAPFAIAYGNKNKILPSLVIAQAILESGYGKSELAQKARNLFGIKKGSGWTGATYVIKTKEYRGGKPYSVTAEFRKYPTYEGAVIDLCSKYANGLRGERVNRYAAVVGEKDYKKAADAVFQSGYATDPEYPKKIVELIQKYDLTKFDNKKEEINMEIKQNLVPKSKYNLKCPNQMVPKYITVHNTANDASAENEIAYMVRNNNATSYHYAVDDKEIIQGIPDNHNAWHCGDGNGKGNMTSIGVEICYSKSGGERYKKAEENAVQLVAYLLKKHNLPITHVKQHNFWSGKDCPHRIRKEGRWAEFLQRVEAELNGIQKLTNKERCTISVKFSNSSSKLKEYKSLLEKLDLEADVVVGKTQTHIDVKFAAGSSRYGDVVLWLNKNGIKY